MFFIVDFGRIPKENTDAVLIMSMMLPGTAIIYYGDEVSISTNCPKKLDRLTMENIFKNGLTFWYILIGEIDSDRHGQYDQHLLRGYPGSVRQTSVCKQQHLSSEIERSVQNPYAGTMRIRDLDTFYDEELKMFQIYGP